MNERFLRKIATFGLSIEDVRSAIIKLGYDPDSIPRGDRANIYRLLTEGRGVGSGHCSGSTDLDTKKGTSPQRRGNRGRR